MIFKPVRDPKRLNECLKCEYLDICTALVEEVEFDEEGNCSALEKLISFIDRWNSIPV